jgi:hypothetical protein
VLAGRSLLQGLQVQALGLRLELVALLSTCLSLGVSRWWRRPTATMDDIGIGDGADDGELL